ncbi:RICIN domain-containing protein [Streptomyces sp. TRM 70351]|uniref:RICIN domain-containing protein n=1 Tax=Streptomyces sp. TRM 70351 TaxID=3116552 RepID=UPI003FCE7B69
MTTAAVAVLAVVLSLLTAAPGGSRAAAAPTPGTYYVLQARHSGKVLDVYEHSTENGADIVQWSRTDAPNQQFRFLDSGGGWYRLQARSSGKVLDVFEHSTENGARIVQWDDTGAANQQFRIEETGDGHHRLVNRLSGKALDVWEHSTDDGARLSQYTPGSNPNQQFAFVPVGPDDGGGDAACGTGSYRAEAVQSGGTWTAPGYRGTDMLAAMRAAVGSLTPGRGSMERVVVRGSGSVPADQSLDLPSHTSVEVCGTIHVTGTPRGDNAVIRARGAVNVAVPHLRVTGNPYFGIFFRNGSDYHLGRIDLRLSGGLGIRIDNHSNRSAPTRNVRIDDVYVSGTGNHGVETYGVDGLTIGTVTARDTAYSGLLLNDTRNATVGRVDAEGAGTGTGYAAFRMANRNGRVGDSYPVNIRVGEVVARGGGRGVFCVSESGGAVIERVDIARTGGDAVLIENCYNVTLASQSGTVAGPGGIRLAARTEFPGNRDITLANLRITDSSLVERPCGTNITYRALTLVNTSRSTC